MRARAVTRSDAKRTTVSVRRHLTPRRRLRADRFARWTVTLGGMGIIGSILAILVFIVIEVLPLWRDASVESRGILPLDDVSIPLALLGDEYGTHVATVGIDGYVRVLRTADGSTVLERRFLPMPDDEADLGSARPLSLTAVTAPPGSDTFSAATSDGRVVVLAVDWRISFEGNQRIVTPVLPEPVAVVIDPDRRPIGAHAARIDDDGNVIVAAQLADGILAIVSRTTTENLLTGEITEELVSTTAESPYQLNGLLLDSSRRNLYGGTARGEILWWRLAADGTTSEPRIASAGPSAITALSLLIGDRSLVVGQENGAISVWFAVRQDEGEARLRRIRDFPAQSGAVLSISPSQRNRGFLAAGASDTLGLYYSTTNELLWTGRLAAITAGAPTAAGGPAAAAGTWAAAGGAPAAATNPGGEPAGVGNAIASLFYLPKADGAYVASGAGVAMLQIDNPHPEVDLRALFGEVWYEGYAEPDHVWQSSGGTDEFEPKLSLTPLLIGTLKGTFYSLLLAIPLGVLGAMYTSQFMHPAYKRYIKPTVEIMAALPSVVLGFLAGLWLAPRIERYVPALILMSVLLPALVLLAGTGWSNLPRRLRNRFATGTEAFLFVVVVAAGIWLCIELSNPFEALIFRGDFQSWLLEATGLGFDQRNAIVVGLAMGFAVIPIIFSIAEDAFSNVPYNLVAGSLALGANRWQTVTRVVLPTASPGIFSAIMVGFGRAVGETMIVLMATGNTPIMDWNPFNGFRTLSANIAVEIPEAPQYGTLYRVLFLAALLLFIITFLVNTLAEVVRQRLRRRFAEL